MAGERAPPMAHLALSLALALTRGAGAPSTLHCDALESASHSPAFCAFAWATGLAAPRKIAVTAAGAALVLDDGAEGARVLALWDADADGHSDASERAALLENLPGLGHGLAASGGYLYASTGGAVRRWAYIDGARSPVVAGGAGQAVVQCTDGSGMSARDLVIDGSGLSLYVVLAASSGGSIRRFALGSLPSAGAFDCADGVLVADGLHAEHVGIGLSHAGQLWGVEDGNMTARMEPPVLALAGGVAPSAIAFFGAAQRARSACVNTSWWTIPSGTAASPYYDYNLNGCPDTWEEDGMCDEIYGTGCPAGSDSADCNSGGGGGGGSERYTGCHGGGFPCDMLGDAFVALSGGGSAGHKVLRLSFDAPGSTASISTHELLSNGGASGNQHWEWTSAAAGFAPAGLAFDAEGRLLITSTSSGERPKHCARGQISPDFGHALPSPCFTDEN